MKVRFLAPALDEFREMIEYYDHEIPGLGRRFQEEVASTIDRIQLLPEGWTRVGRHARRCLLKVFPCALLYSVIEGEIVILAVANLRRDPRSYLERIARE
jgi:plasmid stabilization system protein ParE